MLPVLARIGPITIGTHDFFTILGLLVGLALYYRALRRERMLTSQIVLISGAAILGGAIGARLITGWEAIDNVQAAGLPITYVLTHGPKSIIGGLAGGYLGIVLSKRALGYTLSTGDYYAAAIPLAGAIGRVGCFLSELPLGTPTDLPWGMTVSPVAAAAATARCHRQPRGKRVRMIPTSLCRQWLGVKSAGPLRPARCSRPVTRTR